MTEAPTRGSAPERRLDPYTTGEEPDPRFSLANERTFLAWQRTALALMAGGVGIGALTTHTLIRDLVALTLIVLGLLSAVTALFRWAAAESALRDRRPLPRLRAARALPLALVVVGLLVIVLVLDR